MNRPLLGRSQLWNSWLPDAWRPRTAAPVSHHGRAPRLSVRSAAASLGFASPVLLRLEAAQLNRPREWGLDSPEVARDTAAPGGAVAHVVVHVQRSFSSFPSTAKLTRLTWRRTAARG